MIKIIELTITPEFAEKQLAKLYKPLYENQPVDYQKISFFCRKIKSEEWKKNNDDSPISISENGELMNGLHRLTAIAISGVSVVDKIAFDVPELQLFENQESKIKEKQVFVWCCAELILDYLGIPTRSKSTVEKIYNKIFDRVVCLSDCKERDRKEAAIVCACLCFDNVEENKLKAFKLAKDSMPNNPNNIIHNVYKFLSGVNVDVFRVPLEQFLPTDSYKTVKKCQE